MSERTKSDIRKSVNESPKSEIISNFIAPTGSLSKLSSKNKQEPQREHIRMVESEKQTQHSLSPFAAPISEQITPNTYLSTPVIQQQSYNRDSPSSNLILARSGMIRRNLFPRFPFPLYQNLRMILNLGGAIIMSLFLYLVMCLFTTFGHWEGKVVENKQPPFELGRFHRDRELATLSVATPSHIYCRLNSANHLDSIFSVISKHFFGFKD
jgi:hypothetical protein